MAALTAVELRETATLQALAEGGSGVVSTPSPATVRHLIRICGCVCKHDCDF